MILCVFWIKKAFYPRQDLGVPAFTCLLGYLSLGPLICAERVGVDTDRSHLGRQ